MKKMLLILVIFTFCFTLSAVMWSVQLDTMEANDWWGANLTVYVNGVVVFDHITYEGGWDQRQFNVQNGDQITTLYTRAEMFDYENIYSFWNHLGEMVFISGMSYTPPNSITTPIVVSIPTAAPLPAFNPSPATDSPDRGIAGVLSWNFGAGTEHFQLWFGTPGNMTMVAAGRATTVTGAYNYANLQPLTNYCWQVKSENFLSSIYTESPIWNFSTEVPAVAEFPYVTGFEMEYILPMDWVSVSGSGNWFPNNYAGGFGSSGGSVRARFRDIPGTVPFHLITPPLNMNTLDAIELSFDYAYATYLNRVDKLEIYCSSDYGANYQLYYTMLGGNSGELNTGGSQSTDFIPSIGQWHNKSLSLPLGTNKIRFTATSANGNNLYLDNITLQQGFIDTIFSYAPTSVNFMDTSVGQSCNKAFDAESEYGIANPIWVGISNSGTQTMIIPRENVYLTGVDFDQFWFQNSYFPRTIEAGSGFGLTIQFTPTSSGRKQAQLHIVYHGEDHIVTLSGFAHAETGEFWQRFEGTAFPPDMWSQIGQFEVDPSLGIFGGQSAFILINASEPEQMLITPVLELIGAINELSFVHVGLSNNLGFGSCTLQMKYQLWGTDSWTNLGNPIYYNHPEVVLKSINDLSGLPHGLYRFGFAVTSTFNYLDYTSAVVIDDVYGPNIYNNGVLAAPVVHLAAGRNLSWSTVINANQYQIYSSDRPDGTFSLLASTASNYWLDPDNTVNKRFYQVKAQGSVMRDSTRREQLREFLATQKSNILVWE